jgi:phospholipase C
MQKCVLSILSFLLALTPAAFAGVAVNSPSAGATVQSPVHYVASATSSCAQGVASMGIYTAPNVLAYTSNGASLNTSLNLSPGVYNTVVEEWDFCGGAATVPVTITVSNQSQVQVATPANNSQVGSPVNFVATASS